VTWRVMVRQLNYSLKFSQHKAGRWVTASARNQRDCFCGFKRVGPMKITIGKDKATGKGGTHRCSAGGGQCVSYPREGLRAEPKLSQSAGGSLFLYYGLPVRESWETSYMTHQRVYRIDLGWG